MYQSHWVFGKRTQLHSHQTPLGCRTTCSRGRFPRFGSPSSGHDLKTEARNLTLAVVSCIPNLSNNRFHPYVNIIQSFVMFHEPPKSGSECRIGAGELIRSFTTIPNNMIPIANVRVTMKTRRSSFTIIPSRRNNWSQSFLALASAELKSHFLVLSKSTLLMSLRRTPTKSTVSLSQNCCFLNKVLQSGML